MISMTIDSNIAGLFVGMVALSNLLIPAEVHPKRSLFRSTMSFSPNCASEEGIVSLWRESIWKCPSYYDKNYKYVVGKKTLYP